MYHNIFYIFTRTIYMDSETCMCTIRAIEPIHKHRVILRLPRKTAAT